MFKGGELAREAFELCRPYVEALDDELVLVDAEFVSEDEGLTLRLIIDSSRALTIDDCVRVNDAVTDMLDEDFSYKKTYLLEVSSLGYDSALPDLPSLMRHRDEVLAFSLLEPLGKHQDFLAKILEINGKELKVKLEIDKRGLKGRRLSAKKMEELCPLLVFEYGQLREVRRHLEF